MRNEPGDQIPVERHVFGGLVLYEISGDELDQLENERLVLSEEFSFASVALGVAIALLVTLKTVTFDSDRTYLTFLTVDILAWTTALYFGITWFIGRRKMKSVVKKIRERVGPMGQAGHERRIGEVATLPGRSSESDGVDSQS